MAEKKSEEISLKNRVEACRETLKDLEIKGAKNLFCLKFPEYKPKHKDDLTGINKVNNLYYGKIEDEDFTKKLEEFVLVMEEQFSNK